MSKTIALVDDDRNILTSVTMALEAEGFSVRTYRDGAQALDGQGIALGGARLAEDFLARGALVRPVQATLGSELAFHLVIPAQVPLSPAAALFRDWILAEARRSRAPAEGDQARAGANRTGARAAAAKAPQSAATLAAATPGG